MPAGAGAAAALRLVGRAGRRSRDGGEPAAPWRPPRPWSPTGDSSWSRTGGSRAEAAAVSPEVRRRRTLLAVIGLLLIALALPLSGTGGYSHPAGSALAETRGPVVYTVQPGDSLWSIAERLEPAADPRPLVAKLAAQTGSETVTPGERIVLP